MCTCDNKAEWIHHIERTINFEERSAKIHVDLLILKKSKELVIATEASTVCIWNLTIIIIKIITSATKLIICYTANDYKGPP